jgi:hypothetical protein
MARRRPANVTNSAPSVEFKHVLDDPPPTKNSVAAANYHWTLHEQDTLHEMIGINCLFPVDFPENPSQQQIIDALNNRKRFGDIPNDAIEKILDVMRVPKDRRRLAGELLDVMVRRILSVHDYFGIDFYGKTARAQIARIAKGAEDLADLLVQLDDVASVSLSEALSGGCGPGEELVKLTSTNDPIRAYEILLRQLATCARLQSMPKPKSDPHRPRGSIKHPAFYLLLRDLRRLTEWIGGSLTYRMANGRLKGTAPIVLEMLRPYLPGVIPRELSYSTIRRALLQKAQQST